MCKRLLSGALALVCATAIVRAGPITPGNLVVVRIGGTTGSASAVFLDEFTTAGVNQQTLALPTTTVGAQRRFTNAGNVNTGEGFLALSTNGQFLTLAGHDAAVGTASLAAGAHPRVAARVALDGTIDTSTALPNFGAGSPRSAVLDGDDLWVTNNTNVRAVMLQSFGQTGDAAIINSTLGGCRVAKISAGQLYASADNNIVSSAQGVFTIGAGLPTVPGAAASLLPGFPVGAATDPADTWDYWFATPSTLYVADARTIANGGGLQKWTFDGATWSRSYTLAANLTAGLRGLTGTVGGGGVTLYATSADTASKLVSVTDTGSGADAFTTLATAPAGSVFRGVVLVPEPGALALLCLAITVAVRRR